MKRFSKEEIKCFCKEKFPNKTVGESIEYLKDNYWLTVVNRQSSKKKAYLICEYVLKNK